MSEQTNYTIFLMVFLLVQTSLPANVSIEIGAHGTLWDLFVTFFYHCYAIPTGAAATSPLDNLYLSIRNVFATSFYCFRSFVSINIF